MLCGKLEVQKHRVRKHGGERSIRFVGRVLSPRGCVRADGRDCEPRGT